MKTLLLAAILALFSIAAAAANFSQRAGFAVWREHERSIARLPTSAERALRERHRPRLMLAPGHPGAAYNTVPALKPLALQLFAGYWREDSRGDLERFERLVAEGGDRAAFARAQREVFFQNLDCLRRLGRACR